MRKKTYNLGRLSISAIRHRLKRQNETLEETEERRKRARIYAAVKRANETPEERQKRLAILKMKYKRRRKHAAETTARFAQLAGRKPSANSNKTPEERQKRIATMKMNCKLHKHGAETTARFAQLAARKASPISMETPEQKDLRLMRNRILTAARRASETPEKRENRLLRARIQRALERTFETPEQREKRLSCIRNQRALKRASETPDEKRQRLSRMKYLTALRRIRKKDENVDTRRQTTAQSIRDLCQNIDKECVPNTDTLLQCINEFCSNDSVNVLGSSDKICQNCGTLKLKYILTNKSSRVVETCTTCRRRKKPSTSKTKLKDNIKTENFETFDPVDGDMPIDALTAKDYTVPFIDVIKIEPPKKVMVKTEPKCEENDISDINTYGSDNDNVLLGL